MRFLRAAVLALFPLVSTVAAAPSRRQSTSGTIISPAKGTHIAPGAAFDFAYDSMADFGVTSYNYRLAADSDAHVPGTIDQLCGGALLWALR